MKEINEATIETAHMFAETLDRGLGNPNTNHANDDHIAVQMVDEKTILVWLHPEPWFTDADQYDAITFAMGVEPDFVISHKLVAPSDPELVDYLGLVDCYVFIGDTFDIVDWLDTYDYRLEYQGRYTICTQYCEGDRILTFTDNASNPTAINICNTRKA